MHGLVYRSTGSWYDVKLESGDFIEARLVGKLRTKGIRTTNPIAVGDKVVLIIDKDNKGVIQSIAERKNYIIRKSVNLSKEAHIIAANIDLAILVVTIAYPVTSPGFIDRFTVTAEAYGIPVLIVFNKIDLFNEKENNLLLEFEEAYKKAGYTTLRTSAQNKDGVVELNDLIHGKTVLFSGNSGAGKSTLINALNSDFELKTGELSTTHQTGKHTTTFAEMFDLTTATKIIDTPGIKGFGLVDLEKEELSRYFPEMMALLQSCKFHNCRHINEPGCSVIEAVNKDAIGFSRYKSYLAMYNQDGDNNYRANIYS
ncbi:MAG: ribosome small subunit-dependent GTPase A [Crocinitomicaceae bacterium]|nr:ribosome small subunit-dependent GTPase A [Crocinitomicaceae bacterium]